MLVHVETEAMKVEVAGQRQIILTQEAIITAVHQQVRVLVVRQTIGLMEVVVHNQEVHHLIIFQEVLQALHIHHRQVHLRVALHLAVRQVVAAAVDQDNFGK